MISNVRARMLWLAITMIFTLMMAKIVIPYFSESWDYNFLVTKMGIIHLSYYRVSFMLHISSSLIVIGIGALLFLKGTGRLLWQLHRYLGRVYVSLILLVAAPSGLVMGCHANGGVLGQVNFVLLSILWWWFTFLGYKTIKRGNIKSHRRWMMRSYALTLSAVTLRFIQMLIPMTWNFDPEMMYVTVSWISWLFNILIVEIYIIVYKNSPRYSLI